MSLSEIDILQNELSELLSRPYSPETQILITEKMAEIEKARGKV